MVVGGWVAAISVMVALGACSSGQDEVTLNESCRLISAATVQRLVPQATHTPPKQAQVTQCVWFTPTSGPGAKVEPRELQLLTYVAPDGDTAHGSLETARSKGVPEALPGVGDEAFVITRTVDPTSGSSQANADVWFRVRNATFTVRYWVTRLHDEKAAQERLPAVKASAVEASREVATQVK